eukprot:scaffold3611_cov364-Prasinococcus_capsulatus_cf.AAC.12
MRAAVLPTRGRRLQGLGCAGGTCMLRPPEEPRGEMMTMMPAHVPAPLDVPWGPCQSAAGVRAHEPEHPSGTTRALRAAEPVIARRKLGP